MDEIELGDVQYKQKLKESREGNIYCVIYQQDVYVGKSYKNGIPDNLIKFLNEDFRSEMWLKVKPKFQVIIDGELLILYPYLIDDGSNVNSAGFDKLISWLDEMHGKGWLHLDLAPRNIIVENCTPYLIDYSTVSKIGMIPIIPLADDCGFTNGLIRLNGNEDLIGFNNIKSFYKMRGFLGQTRILRTTLVKLSLLLVWISYSIMSPLSIVDCEYFNNNGQIHYKSQAGISCYDTTSQEISFSNLQYLIMSSVVNLLSFIIFTITLLNQPRNFVNKILVLVVIISMSNSIMYTCNTKVGYQSGDKLSMLITSWILFGLSIISVLYKIMS